MNGVGLTTVGRLLGHRQRETTAIYAHLADGALRDAAAQATAVIARAIGYRAEAPPMPDDGEHRDVLADMPVSSRLGTSALPEKGRSSLRVRVGDPLPSASDSAKPESHTGALPGRPVADWVVTLTFGVRSPECIRAHGPPVAHIS